MHPSSNWLLLGVYDRRIFLDHPRKPNVNVSIRVNSVTVAFCLRSNHGVHVSQLIQLPGQWYSADNRYRDGPFAVSD